MYLFLPFLKNEKGIHEQLPIFLWNDKNLKIKIIVVILKNQ